MHNLKLYGDILAICFMAALAYLILLGIITDKPIESIMRSVVILAICIPLNLKYNHILRSLIEKWRK